MSDDLREQLAEALTAHLPGYVDGTCGCGDGTDTDVRHLTDALLPLIRDHVAAAVQAEREIPLRVAADHMAECRECGIEHKPRPHPNGPRYADTWAAEDGHTYRSRNRTVADVLRNELEATDG